MVGERPRPFGEALGFDPATSTSIFGEYDAVLVDAMTTVAEAEASRCLGPALGGIGIRRRLWNTMMPSQ
jgi:hypothetical protein